MKIITLFKITSTVYQPLPGRKRNYLFRHQAIILLVFAGEDQPLPVAGKTVNANIG